MVEYARTSLHQYNCKLLGTELRYTCSVVKSIYRITQRRWEKR